MNKHKYLVTTNNHHGTHSEIWDSAHPKPLGFPFRWVLENTKNGVRIRNINYKIGTTTKEMTIQISDNAISNEEYISIPHDSGNSKHFHKIKISKLHAVRPAYVHQDYTNTETDSAKHLLAFAGVRRSLISTQEVRAAYIAYCKSKPVFSFFYKKGKYTIKPLSNDIQLKLKGKAPTFGVPGSNWEISEEDILQSTLICGIYWWKFNQVSIPRALVIDEEKKEAPVPFFRTSKFILSFVFTLLTITSVLIPPRPQEEKKEAPVVQLKFKTANKEIPRFGNQTEASKLPEVADASAFEEQVKKEPSRATEKPQVTPKAMGQPKPTQAQEHTKKIKDIFKGFKAIVSKNTNVTEASTTNSQKGSKIFDSSGNGGISKTQVKPIGGGNFGKVDGIGGGVAGGDGVSYGKGTGKKGILSGSIGNFVGLDPAGSKVDEGLTKEEVGKVIHDHMDEVRACHEAALVMNPKVSGKMMANFSIGADGRVKRADAPKSDLSESKLDSCIVSKLKTWQFPHPKGGVTVSVAYPFIFKTLGRD